MPLQLISLPREVRDEIYEYVYLSGTYLLVTRFRGRNVNHLEAEKNTLSLRLVNRQISLEATICFHSSSISNKQLLELLYFLRQIGDCRNLIKRIAIEATYLKVTGVFPPGPQVHVLQLFKTMNTLPTLHTIKTQTVEKDMKGIRARLSGWTKDQLDSHVEIVGRNRSFDELLEMSLY